MLRDQRTERDAVPRARTSKDEQTQPIPRATARGTTHAQLRALAEGSRTEPLVLAERYRIDRCLGKGGMAQVFRGRLLSLGRPVALKILDDERGHRDNGLARFMAEARIMARLSHPNVAEVSDFGSTREGVVYMAMELLDGEDLNALLRREGPLPWPPARELMLQICAGLAAGHATGVIHRDLKPANCYCTPTGVKLLDYGIAAKLRAPDRDDRRLTEQGRVVGTPEYMSPEQARGDEVDERSDVYAAGILLGEMLTGRVAFEGKSSAGVIAAQIYEPAPRLRELAPEGVEIPPRLERIYARALSKDPAARFASIDELAEALAALAPDAPTRTRSLRGRAWLAAAAVLTAAWVAFAV